MSKYEPRILKSKEIGETVHNQETNNKMKGIACRQSGQKHHILVHREEKKQRQPSSWQITRNRSKPLLKGTGKITQGSSNSSAE